MSNTLYEVFQAMQGHAEKVGERGPLTMRDVLSLALTCRRHHQWLQPWVARMHDRHVSSVRTFEYMALKQSLPWVNVYVSKWAAHGMSGGSPRSVRVIIDKPDSDALGDICDWLGGVQPRHLYFLTYNLSKAINSCMTDAMLQKCCSNEKTELLCICNCTAVTDDAIRQLLWCRALIMGRCTGITPASLATLPSLEYVMYIIMHDPVPPPHDPMTAWLQRKAAQGMLKTLIC